MHELLQRYEIRAIFDQSDPHDKDFFMISEMTIDMSFRDVIMSISYPVCTWLNE